jgi:hypothetical protein
MRMGLIGMSGVIGGQWPVIWIETLLLRQLR